MVQQQQPEKELVALEELLFLVERGKKDIERSVPEEEE